MPVLLANADPGFPFVDCVRKQAGDLFPAPGTAKPRVIDFAETERARAGPGPAGHRQAGSVEREVWGFWPPVRAGNGILIRDDLVEFAALAEAGTDAASWAVILVDRASLVRLADAEAAETGPLTREILKTLREKKRGIDLGATRVRSADISRNLYLRRVLAVPSDLGPNADALAAAYALVEEDLVDNVVFLAARDPRAADRDPVYFAGLRLVESLAAIRDVETWFEGVGEKQRGVPVTRITIDRALLDLPTEGHRRLALVQRMIENLREVAWDSRREAAVKQTADEIADIRRFIERDEPADEGRLAVAFSETDRGFGWIDALWRHSRTAAGDLLAYGGEGIAAMRETVRADLHEDPVEGSPHRRKAVRREAAAKDRALAGKLEDLKSGVFQDAGPGDYDLATGTRAQEIRIEGFAADQRARRARLLSGTEPAEPRVPRHHLFHPPDEHLDRLAEPIRIPGTGYRESRAFDPPVSEGLARHAETARAAAEAAGGLVHGAGIVFVLAATAFAAVYPAFVADLVTWTSLREALTGRNWPLAVFFGALAGIPAAAGLVAWRLSAAAYRRAVATMRRARDASIAAPVSDWLEAAREHRAARLKAGRFVQLRRRLKAFSKGLEKLDAVKRVQSEILSWATPTPGLGADVVEAHGAKLDDELSRLPRERWVAHLLRTEIPAGPRGTVHYALDGGTPKPAGSAVFLDGPRGGPLVELARLPRPADVPAASRRAAP